MSDTGILIDVNSGFLAKLGGVHPFSFRVFGAPCCCIYFFDIDRNVGILKTSLNFHGKGVRKNSGTRQ